YSYNQQFCRDTLSGRQLYVGEVFTRSGQCMRVQCLGTLQLWEDSCKVPVSLKGDCTRLEQTADNTNQDYPKCCPLYECKTNETNMHSKLEMTNIYDHNSNLRKSNVNEVIIVNNDRHHLASGHISTVPVRKYQV
ncbi:Vago, partial [Drosophila busckii]